jgi:hypothetical protein
MSLLSKGESMGTKLVELLLIEWFVIIPKSKDRFIE